MPYIITEKCIECGSCQPFCKNKAIRYDDRHYIIDELKCEMCSTCKEYCPIDDAIVDKAALPAMAA
jgi:ferredoxin